MTNMILNVFEITIGMSLFIALLLLGLKLFGGKFTAKCRYIIWVLVILRLAIPFSFGILPTLIEIPIETEDVKTEAPPSVLSENSDPITSVQPSVPGDMAVTPTVPSTPVFPNVDPANPGSTPILPVTPSVPGDQAESVIPSEPNIETPAEQPVSLKQILDIAGIVYLIGAAGFLVWNLLSYVIYTRKIQHSAKAADHRTQQIFSTICKKYGIKQQPTLLVASGIHSPAAFGIFRRRIMLPDIAFTENGLVGTLTHEVTHCKRGDLFVKLAELIARSLHWFNPLVHMAAFRCEMEMELSCDESVLAGCNEESRAAYAEVMLDIIRRCRRNRGALTTHFNPKKSAVAARFKNILYGSGKRHGWILIAVCLVLCVSAGAIVACTAGDGSDDEHLAGNTDLPENFDDLYFEAEAVYALFTGYRSDIYTAGTFSENGAQYRTVDINGYTTLAELQAFCGKYFAPELIETLVSRTVGEHPLFREHKGKLARIDGYTALFGYDVGDNYNMTLESCENGVSTVRIDAAMTENGRKIPAAAYCSYTLSEEGEIRFTAFELMAEKLSEALEQMPVEPTPFDPDAYAALIPDSSAQRLFWHRISGTDDYLYFCAIRTVNSTMTGYTDDPPKEFAIYHINSSKTDELGYVDAVIPADIVYDTVCPVVAIDGSESEKCEFVLQLTNADETFYVSFANYDNILSGNPLEFDFAGILGDDRVNEFKAQYPEAFRKAENRANTITDIADIEKTSSLFGQPRSYYTEIAWQTALSAAEQEQIRLDKNRFVNIRCGYNGERIWVQFPGVTDEGWDDRSVEVMLVRGTDGAYSAEEVYIISQTQIQKNLALSKTRNNIEYLAEVIDANPSKYSADIPRDTSTYDEIFLYGKELVLEFIFSEFIGGSQTGTYGSVMQKLMTDILNENEIIAYDAENGQDYFDHWLASARSVGTQHDTAWLRENVPAIALALEMTGNVNLESSQNQEKGTVKTAEILNSILENKQSFYVASSKESVLLSEYKAKTDYSVKKYTILDLNDDRDPEMVLWLGYGENDYAGFLVLHRDGDTVYAHGFPYRDFNGLNGDGVYTSSSSALNMSILKLEFDGDTCTESVLARREGDGSAEPATYYIEDRIGTEEEFENYWNRYNSRGIPAWYSYDIDEITDIDD